MQIDAEDVSLLNMTYICQFHLCSNYHITCSCFIHAVIGCLYVFLLLFQLKNVVKSFTNVIPLKYPLQFASIYLFPVALLYTS